jgi:hypothetical protein
VARRPVDRGAAQRPFFIAENLARISPQGTRWMLLVVTADAYGCRAFLDPPEQRP